MGAVAVGAKAHVRSVREKARVVALETEIRHFYIKKLFIAGAVGVVATQASALFDRPVHNRPRLIHRLMALIAKIRGNGF